MNIKVHVLHIVYTVRNGLHRDLYVLRVTRRFWGKRKKWSCLPSVTACISKILNLESPFCGSQLQSDSVILISVVPSRTIESLSLPSYLAMMKIRMWPSVILKATPSLTHRFYIFNIFFMLYKYLIICKSLCRGKKRKKSNYFCPF